MMKEKTPAKKVYALKLYVSGATNNSLKAISNITHICDEYLKCGYELKIIDIYKEPGTATEQQGLAVPALVRSWPLPAKKLIGNFSDAAKVITDLDLFKKY